jgi:hypothetical protein
MTKQEDIAESVRNAIVDMLWTKQRMVEARWVRDMDLTHILNKEPMKDQSHV